MDNTPLQLISFTNSDGSITYRLMRPRLDDMGHVLSWVPADDSRSKDTRPCCADCGSPNWCSCSM